MNYTKWSFLIGTPLVIISTAIALLSIPSIGCRTGLYQDSCTTDTPATNANQLETEEARSDLSNSTVQKDTTELRPSTEEAFEGQQVPSVQPSEAIVTSNEGFSFQLNSCTQESDQVVCELVVTDEQDARELRIFSTAGPTDPESAIVDVDGNRYEADQVEFGGRDSYSYIIQALSQGIGVKAKLIFEDVQLPGDRLALVDIAAASPVEDDSFHRSFSVTAQFRDVSVLR